MLTIDDLQYCSGEIRTIIFAKTENDRYPAEEFLQSLEKKHSARLSAILKSLSKKQTIFNTQLFRKANDQIYEVKTSKYRLIGYFQSGYFILTHGFEKRGGGKSANRTPRSEKKRAARIISEFDPVLEQLIKEQKEGGGFNGLQN